jgi:glycosyltransferase involved in cell wall biosynthesis
MKKNEKPSIAFFGLKGLPSQGGTAAVGENIIRQLSNDFNITVYATSTHASQKEPVAGVRQIIFKALPLKKLNVFYYNLMSALHALFFGRYNLVHTHQIDIAFIIPILKLRYKVVSTHHGKTYEVNKWGRLMRKYFRMSERLMLRKADVVTFVADTERHDKLAEYPGNYLYIPNGINRPVEEADAIRKDYLLFAAGRIIPHKGCHVFLDALTEINYKGKVIIAGNHESIPAYRDQLLAYRSNLDIEFKGMITRKEELRQLVRETRLFVYPTFYEAMSMMLLEVAAEKTPMICSDIRENRAVLNDDEVIFFKTGDADDLAQKITQTLNDPQKAQECTRKAFEKLITTYCWDTIALQYKEVYEKLLAK